MTLFFGSLVLTFFYFFGAQYFLRNAVVSGDETMAPYTSTGTGADVVGDGFVARQTPTDAVEAAASAAREHPIKGVFTVGPPTAPTATPRKAAGKGGKSKKGGK